MKSQEEHGECMKKKISVLVGTPSIAQPSADLEILEEELGFPNTNKPRGLGGVQRLSGKLPHL